jgi:hypothetical protein
MVGPNRQVHFAGTPRYQVLARLGQGGMGVVFHAFDRERQEEVALKTLIKASPTALHLFKQEFRALADVVHPNLVSLYEMSVVDGLWFFTMELVRGLGFLDHAWGTTGAFERSTLLSEEEPVALDDNVAIAGLRVVNVKTLTDATIQLVQGLSALHGAGKLHLDVKPANVLVSSTGRVVLLDFGLVTDIADANDARTRSGGGTWAYMAPERLARSTVGPASDFFSLGVMLYQALTGRLPFDVKDITTGLASRRLAPTPPIDLVPAVPAWLSELCVSLLAIDPAARPSGVQILERLGAPREMRGLVTLSADDADEVFTGREGAFATLANALADVSSGRAVSVRLRGASGMGKSTLIRHFLRGLRLRREATILDGRCYDRESVPFKGLDTIVDRLVDHLAGLPPEVTNSYVATDSQYLTELFPVLRRIKSFTASTVDASLDALERRRRAFRALKELLRRLGAAAPIVMLIDDFQWGDVDSAIALGEVLAGPDAPPILLLTCDRGEDSASSLHDLIRRPGSATADLAAWTIDLEPLDEASARRVAAALLERFGQDDERGELVAAITNEARGNPYFIHELAQSPLAGLEDAPGDEGRATPSLERLLHERVEKLPEAAKELIEIVVLSGRPLDGRDAVAAAGITGQDRMAVALLRALRLLTVRSVGSQILVDTYHDRIRHAVGQTMSEEKRRKRHADLATVLEARGGVDPETLAEHHLAAGHRDRAGAYSLEAARQAAGALAFDRAANLYRRSIELMADHAARWELEASLAEALANAGKSEEAGDAFLRASNALAVVEPTHASLVLWKRRSFEEYLRAGRLDKGREQLTAMTALVGVKLPRTRGQKIASLLGERFKLGLRKIDMESGGDRVDPTARLRLEVCWGIAVPMSMIDPLLSNFLYTRHLILALEQRSPHHVGRGLATEVTNLASLGGAKRLARAARLTAILEKALQQSPDPYTASMVHAARTVVAHMTADFRGSYEHGARWEEMIRSVPGASFELGTVQTFSALALGYLGRLRDMESRLDEIVRENEERGNLLHGTSLRLLETFGQLRRDGAEEALRAADATISRWPGEGFHLQHYFHLIAAVQAHLYAGNGRAAWDVVEKAWPRVHESLFLSVRACGDEMHFLRARAALARAAKGDGAAAALASAAKDARRIAASGLVWSRGLAALVEGGVLALRKQKAPAAAKLTEAATLLDAAGMKIHAEIARLGAARLGGRDLPAEPSPMREEGVANPERFAELFLPGAATAW